MQVDIGQPAHLLRAPVARGLAEGVDSVDREGGDNGAGVIRGMAVITRGEAAGHGLWIDATMLEQVREAINAAGETGVKSRFTHPGLSGDGLGSFLGRSKGAAIDGDVVRSDLHFARTAHNSPDGDLAAYVMDLAAEDPAAFGNSISFRRDFVAEDQFIADHTETVEVQEADGTKRRQSVFKSPDPDNVNNLPHFRIATLKAVDTVDSPAANPDGMFHRGQEVAEDAESLLSYALGLSDNTPALTALDIEPDRVSGFVKTFLDRHGLAVVSQNSQENEMPDSTQQSECQTSAEDTQQTAEQGAGEEQPEQSQVTETEAGGQTTDLDAVRKEAAKAEAKRQSEIRALCQQAGFPDKADHFCADPDFTVEDVREHLFDAMLKKNKAPGDDGPAETEQAKDPDEALKVEYREQETVLSGMGITEEQYLRSRRIDEKGGTLPMPSAN